MLIVLFCFKEWNRNLYEKYNSTEYVLFKVPFNEYLKSKTLEFAL